MLQIHDLQHGRNNTKYRAKLYVQRLCNQVQRQLCIIGWSCSAAYYLLELGQEFIGVPEVMHRLSKHLHPELQRLLESTVQTVGPLHDRS